MNHCRIAEAGPGEFVEEQLLCGSAVQNARDAVSPSDLQVSS